MSRRTITTAAVSALVLALLAAPAFAGQASSSGPGSTAEVRAGETSGSGSANPADECVPGPRQQQAQLQNGGCDQSQSRDRLRSEVRAGESEDPSGEAPRDRTRTRRADVTAEVAENASGRPRNSESATGSVSNRAEQNEAAGKAAGADRSLRPHTQRVRVMDGLQDGVLSWVRSMLSWLGLTGE